MRTTNDWIREHLLYQAGMSPIATLDEIQAHVDRRISRAVGLIRTRVAVGYIRYESNRGRSPCYLEWLETALAEYQRSGNLDALLDVSFYAMAEFENPSKEGTFYNPEKQVRDER